MKSAVDIPALVKAKVLEIDPSARVILYGSRARGDYHKNSDWDFLVLLQKDILQLFDTRQIRNAIYDIELEYEQILSTYVLGIEQWKSKTNLFSREVNKEGIPL